MLPSSVHFNSMSASQGNCALSTGCNRSKDGTVIRTLRSLSNGSSATVTIVVTPTKPGTVTNWPA